MKPDDPKIVSLPGGGKPDAFADAIRNLKANRENMLEYLSIDAELKAKHFKSLISAGFNREEALKIIIAKSLP